MHWVAEKEVLEFVSREDMKMIWGRMKENPFLEKGILTNSGKFDSMDSEIAKKEIIKFLGAKEKITYKLHDWVFSRQRYWGEPIPVLRDGNKVIPLKEKDLPVILPKVKFYEPTGTAESPLAGLPNWMNVKVGQKIFKRESNTMPQWAGSSWYVCVIWIRKTTKRW